MTKRSWVQTPALILDGCKQFATYYIKKIENKGSQMGHNNKKKKKKKITS
jgi:hypothetical protein